MLHDVLYYVFIVRFVTCVYRAFVTTIVMYMSRVRSLCVCRDDCYLLSGSKKKKMCLALEPGCPGSAVKGLGKCYTICYIVRLSFVCHDDC